MIETYKKKSFHSCVDVIAWFFIKEALISTWINITAEQKKHDITNFIAFQLSKREKSHFPASMEKPYFLINARVVLIEKVDGELIWEKFCKIFVSTISLARYCSPRKWNPRLLKRTLISLKNHKSFSFPEMRMLNGESILIY